MAHPSSYLGNNLGPGKYAQENEAMLDRECLRTHDWQNDPASRARRSVPFLPIAAVLLMAIVASAAVYMLAFGDLH